MLFRSASRQEILKHLDDKTAAVIVQNPNFFGVIDDLSDIIEQAHKVGALALCSVYPVSLGLLKTPGAMGADIVTGEGQSLGLPLNFGGPYLGFMATRKKHIRREKATSNICTNVSLCAVQSVIYMSMLGKEGLKELAQLNLDKAEFMRQQLEKIKGVQVKRSSPTFNEFAIALPKDASVVVGEMIKKGFAAGFPLGRYYPGMERYLLVAVTEKRTKQEIMDYAKALQEVLG